MFPVMASIGGIGKPKENVFQVTDFRHFCLHNMTDNTWKNSLHIYFVLMGPYKKHWVLTIFKKLIHMYHILYNILYMF